jgi:hypothetical protein
VRARTSARLELIHRSRRPLAHLADGMIRSCIARFGDHVGVDRQDLDASEGRAARFILRAARVRAPRRRASA